MLASFVIALARPQSLISETTSLPFLGHVAIFEETETLVPVSLLTH